MVVFDSWDLPSCHRDIVHDTAVVAGCQLEVDIEHHGNFEGDAFGSFAVGNLAAEVHQVAIFQSKQLQRLLSDDVDELTLVDILVHQVAVLENELLELTARHVKFCRGLDVLDEGDAEHIFERGPPLVNFGGRVLCNGWGLTSG